MILYKKYMLMLLLSLILFSSIMAVSANDSNLTDIECVNGQKMVISEDLDDENFEISEYYVSPEGDDFTADGSSENPFSSISTAMNVAGNNSKIILKDGVYKGSSNTEIVINKYVTIEAQSKATINGESKYWFFNVLQGSGLALKNINFINGKTDSYSQLGVIKNNGNLIVNNSSFNNMQTIMGAFFNEGTLTLENTVVSNAKSSNMAQILVNIGNCSINNSKLTATVVYSSSEISAAVYNYNNLNVSNSQIDYLQSNLVYDEYNYSPAFILIENSTMANIELENISSKISNSKINGNAYFKGADIHVDSTTFNHASSLSTMTLSDSNFTAVHSVFTYTIHSSFSDLNITYSAILASIYGGGKIGYLHAPYNWWGSNSGPSFDYFRNYNVSCWAISDFEVEDGNLSVGTTSKFIASLNKWSDGNSTYLFKPGEYLPSRPVSFEAQNGRFLFASGNLNNEFSNYLIGNILDCLVYSIVDDQRLSLVIGMGMSAYTYFVSPNGHDGPEDGSLEKPFWSLGYALKKAGNGNTICLLEGVHLNNANSDVTIDKNITIVGFGDVSIRRANAFNVFKIREWGSLLVKNIKFIVDVRDYTESIFTLTGGNLTILNCNFTGITTPAVIYTDSGNEGNGLVVIEDCYFNDIQGAVSNGPAKVYVKNSLFEKISNYYHIKGFEYYNSVFPVTTSIEIYNSTFRQNTVGIVNLHPYTYSSASLLGVAFSDYSLSYNRYAYIENSLFEDNVFKSDSYSSNGVGLDLHDTYGSFNGFINNCTFIGNRGKIAFATNINSSTFYNNRGEAYAGEALVTSDSIDNSIFVGNLNQYITYDDAYLGEGIASADRIWTSIFINNAASFGGAVSSTREVHYCVFVNNTAKYSGNDIYSPSGDVDYSYNWWGINQKPTTDNIFIFLGNLKLENWIIMTIESISGNVVEVALNNVINDNGDIRQINHVVPVRPVYFSIDGGIISPESTYLSNNRANATLSYDIDAQDLKVYGRIDNQVLDLDVQNSNTRLIMEDVSFKGNNNKYNVSLINVNGHQIFNQTLMVEITGEDGITQRFPIVTDEKGFAEFDVDYPIGEYDVVITYLGNGYFDKCNKSAKIVVIGSGTRIVGYDSTYYGKNNRYVATLYDENERKLTNFPIQFTIVDSQGMSSVVTAYTDHYGQAEIIFSLDVGKYKIKSEYLGDSWYEPSSVERNIEIKPANSVLIVPDVTLYGQGALYNITLKDEYGSLIAGENIIVTLSQGDLSDKFTLKTNDMGVASLAINYLPGKYNVKAEFIGDEVYGHSAGSGVINVEKVLTVVSGFHHVTMPLNGVYTVVLTDMYGRRVNNETIILNCYKGNLIKSYQLNTDPNGEASFVIDLDEGSYLTTYDYGGNQWYADATNAATIVISKDAQLQKIQLNSTDLVQYYGENKYFIIEFNDPNAYSQYGKTIQVTLSSGEWSQAYDVITDVFGLGRLQINLNPGEYNITYKYSNPYYNIFGSGSNTISVYKMPATILAKDVIMNVGEARLYEISLRDVNNAPIKNMQVKVDINGTGYDLTTNNNGIARLLISLDLGTYTIAYSMDNPNYEAASGSSTILVVDSDKTSSNIAANDFSGYDNETIKLSVNLNDVLGNGIGSSEISLEILTFDGESIMNLTKTTDYNGFATFEFELESGNYIVRLKYAGNNLYLSSSTVNTINVESSDNKIKTLMFKGDNQIKNSKYSVVLSDVNGTLLANKTIIFYFANSQYSTKTDENGKAYLDIELYPDVYTVKSVFEGDDEYKKVSASTKLYVSGDTTQLNVFRLVKYYRNGTQFHAQLIDSYGFGLSNKTVQVVLENITYNCTTDDEGWITLKIDLKPGRYNVECYYYGKIPYENSFNTTTITVLTTVIGENAIKYYGESPYLTVRFLEGNGNPIKNTQFVICIDGINYIATTGSDGLFNFNLNLNSGKHIISVTNPYDGLSESYDLEILPTVFVEKIIKLLGDGQYYSAFLLDKNGTPLFNRDVDVIIDGIKYTYTTDDFGEIRVDLELTPKNYLVTVINPDSGEYIENNIDVIAPICENKNLVMYFNNGASYKVKIMGKNGKAAGKGVSVKFTINGKKYYAKTDSKGYASLKITLKPNKYTVVAQYNNYKVSNKITVKPVLTAKNVSKKKGKAVKFKAKLVNGKGKPLKGKKITFKIKGKKYKAKTNKRGIATIKIKLKLKVGKHKIKTIYGKSSIVNKIKIKK